MKKIKWVISIVGTGIMRVEDHPNGTITYLDSTQLIAKDRKVFDTPNEALKAVRKNLVQGVSHAHDHYKHLVKRLEEFDLTNSEFLKE